MFVIKIALLIFALVIIFESSISWWYRIPLCLGAILLEQVLNGYTEDNQKWGSEARRMRSKSPRYSHALFGCNHQDGWGFIEDVKSGRPRLGGDFEFKCEGCGYSWIGKVNDPKNPMPEFIIPLLKYARTH